MVPGLKFSDEKPESILLVPQSIHSVIDKSATNAERVQDLSEYATAPPEPYEKRTDFGQPIEGHRYRILRPFASGGLGQVSIAYDEALKREVALKETREHYTTDSRSRARFLLEAEITAGLEHPGVVPALQPWTIS
jgi:hypothetical protein